MTPDLSKPRFLPSRSRRVATALLAVAVGGSPAACASAPSAGPLSVAQRDAGRTLSVGFVVIDGVYNTELIAPLDVFEHAAHQSSGTPALTVFTVSEDGEQITTAEGLRLQPDYSFATAPSIDILVVPSAENSRGADLENERLIAFVAERGRQAKLTVSLCWGAFVLAQAGLLDDRAVTTFPRDYDTLWTRFPDLDLRVNVSFVHDGPVVTSQGGTLSYDVAMYLVDLLFGEETAKGVAGGLLIPWPRSDAIHLPPFVADPTFELTDSP